MSISTPTPSPAFSIRRSSKDSPAVHLVGISGAGMKALAEWLVGAGYRVTGSDAALTVDLRGLGNSGGSTASRSVARTWITAPASSA